MRRELRRFAAALGALAGAAALGCGAFGESPKSPPNLLLITIDTLRADHTSLHGYRFDTTPGLVALGAQGTRFEQAFVPVATTAPTHATLFTGNYPATHRLVKNGRVLAASALTLAEELAERGYQTGGVVSSFVLDAKFGFGQGFAEYADDFQKRDSTMKTNLWAGHEVPDGFDGRADFATRRASSWLWKRDPERPFFLFVHYFDPHAPYVPPDEYRDRFVVEDGEPRLLGRRVEIRNYDAEVAFADREIARLLETVERAGLAETTLVIVTADHGEGLFDHGFWLHGYDVYEESVRVPLVFRWPGRIPAGRVIDEPVEMVDLMPTILDLLGVARDPAAYDGRSLAAALTGNQPLDPDRPVFLYRGPFTEQFVDGVKVGGEQYAVRSRGWKLIDHVGHGRDELYDLNRDPGEQHDLYDAAPDRVAELSEVLRAWQRDHVSDFEVPEISEADRRALEAMGYVE